MKKYLKNMNKEELKKVFDTSVKIQNKEYEATMQMNMDYQEELGVIFFGKGWSNYIKMYNNYNSFYLRIIDSTSFFENLTEDVTDYLSQEDAKYFKEIYKKAKKFYTNINSRCVYGSDKYYENYEKFEEECKKLLEILEDELHKLESVDYEQAFDTFCTDVMDNNIFDEFYIIDEDYTKVFEHVDYVKEW